MIPIEKNIIVSDVNGRRIGATYPKRAKGLVKNGRAEFISDHEIRLLITQLPAVPIDTEDEKMSKVIQFDARAFGFDPSCETNTGYRGFITTENGNEEIWEIGDWGWNWTQIQTHVSGMEKNTDYVFRFAMTLGHNDDDREESLVHILYLDGDDKQAWNDRFTYCIGKSRFQPVISKRAIGEDTMLRVFELPFNTGEHTEFKILIISQHAVARFFRAADNASYEGMEDLSYAQWRTERTATLEAKTLQQNLRMNMQFPALPNMQHVSGMDGIMAKDSVREMIESAIEDSVRDMMESAIEESKEEIADMLEDRIEETINNSISKFFQDGMETWAIKPKKTEN